MNVVLRFFRWAIVRLLLVAGGLIVGLLLAEEVVRLMAPSAGADLFFGAPDAIPPGLYMADPELGLTLKPGYETVIETLDYRVPIRINRHGFRGPEPQGDGTNRWIMVGDSFVLGMQVPEEQTFSDRLARLMNLEVINGGVDSYSTWQEVLRYRRLSDQFPVEGVILVFFLGNDFTDNERFSHGMVSAPPAEKPDPNRPKPEDGPQDRGAGSALRLSPLKRFLFKHSAIYAYARVAARRALVTRKNDPTGFHFKRELEFFSKKYPNRLTPAINDAKRPLIQLRDLARERGDKVIVAVAPTSFAMDPTLAADTLETFGFSREEADVDLSRIQMMGAITEIGLPGCDLTPALRQAYAGGDRPYFRFDGHWNAIGHGVVAGALSRCMRAAWPDDFPAPTP